MIRKSLLLSVLLAALSLSACGEAEKPPKESYTYNVWLEHIKGKKVYAGTVVGLSSCKYIANQKIGGSKNPGWSYFCCWQHNDDKCYDRHK